MPVGLACPAPYILLHVNETGAYLRRAPAFLVPKDISACTNALGAADREVPPKNVCRMLLLSLWSGMSAGTGEMSNQGATTPINSSVTGLIESPK